MFKSILHRIAGRYGAQRLLESGAKACLYLMGVGTGGVVATSGEKAVFKAVQKFRSPLLTVFDAGANRGQFLNLLLENISGKDLVVHCFEPGVRTFQLLEQSISPGSSIVLNNVGLGHTEGSGELFFDYSGSGLASLTRRNVEHYGFALSESETVELTTVDTYCEKRDIGHIDLLKIDVEGHEMDVLMGARRMFNNRSIRCVTFEFGPCNIDTHTFFQDFYYFFKEREMNLFRITPSGYFHPILAYQELYDQFRLTNFLALDRKLNL